MPAGVKRSGEIQGEVSERSWGQMGGGGQPGSGIAHGLKASFRTRRSDVRNDKPEGGKRVVGAPLHVFTRSGPMCSVFGLMCSLSRAICSLWQGMCPVLGPMCQLSGRMCPVLRGRCPVFGDARSPRLSRARGGEMPRRAWDDTGVHGLGKQGRTRCGSTGSRGTT